MAEIASAFVSIAPSARGFRGKLDSEISGDVNASGKKAGIGFGKMFAGAAALGVGAAAATIFKGAIDQASGLEEAGTKITAIFGDQGSSAVQKFADQGAKALGQNRLAVLDSAATFGVMGKAAGLGGQDLAKFSTGFASLSTDLASFNNSTPEEATMALGAALRGEAEPIRRFGVLLDDATLRNEALKLGLIKTTKDALTPANKVLAAQAAIYKQTKDAQGDFQKTSGGLANQQRILSAQWTDMKGVLGQALLPAVTSLFTSLNNSVVPAVTGFINGMKSGVGAGGQFAAVMTTIGSAVRSTVGFVNQHRTALAGLAIAIGAVVVVTKLHTAAMAIQAAGGLAAMVKTLPIVTGLTKAWAAGQWLLNAALTANPIGLVVVGIAALAAGLVYAYKRSETFRKIVDGAFAGVKVAAAAVVGFFTKSVPAAFNTVQSAAASALGWVKGNWPKILAILTGPFGIAAALIIKNWESIKAGGMRVLDFIQSIPGKIASVFSGAATLLYNAGVQLMTGLGNGIKAQIENAIDAVRSGLSRLKGLLPGSPIKWGPLKGWNNGGAGKRLMDLVTLGITKGTPKTIKAAEEAFGKIGDALKSTRSDLQSTLAGLKSDFAALADSVSKAFTGDLFGVTATEAVAGSRGVAAIAAKSVGENFISNLMAKKGELTGLLTSFQTLKGWGLDPSFLSQLFASGNGALITELASMGQSGALNAGSLFADVNTLGSQLGGAVATNDPVTTRIDETNRLLAKVDQQLGYLGSDIGKELNQVAAKSARKSKPKGRRP